MYHPRAPGKGRKQPAVRTGVLRWNVPQTGPVSVIAVPCHSVSSLLSSCFAFFNFRLSNSAEITHLKKTCVFSFSFSSFLLFSILVKKCFGFPGSSETQFLLHVQTPAPRKAGSLLSSDDFTNDQGAEQFPTVFRPSTEPGTVRAGEVTTACSSLDSVQGVSLP